MEPIIQGEVSQKEKHQYSILTHIYGIKWDMLSYNTEASLFSVSKNIFGLSWGAINTAGCWHQCC